jgi:RsiW-degrading membrane proteinase PrsW (M82 family)
MNHILDFISGINLVLLSFLPGLLYLGIIFLTSPYKSWNFGRSLAYLLGGSLSTLLLFFVYELFPFWDNLYLIPDNFIGQLLIMAFIQVAFLEEVVKFVMYWLFRTHVLKIKDNQHPLATMIYAGSVALGFAFIENVMYGFNYTSDILYWRATTSVILHMVTGMMMGYWISLSQHKFKIKTNPTDDVMGISIFDVIMRNNTKFRNIFYVSMGLISAIFFHGLYDFNLFGIYEFQHSFVDENISWSIQLLILFLSLYLVRNMSNHLIKLNINNKAYGKN